MDEHVRKIRERDDRDALMDDAMNAALETAREKGLDRIGFKVEHRVELQKRGLVPPCDLDAYRAELEYCEATRRRVKER